MKTEIHPLDVIVDTIKKLIDNSEDIVLLVADAFACFFLEYKGSNRYYNVGIAEQNTIGIASGLAKSGKRVVIFGMGTFLSTRCYEQIKIDLCFMNHPVVIVGWGTGYASNVGGPTHHIINDVSITRALPNLTIYSPSDCTSAKVLLKKAVNQRSPCYLRIDKGPFIPMYSKEISFDKGVYEIQKGKDCTLISTSIMTSKAFEIIKDLTKKGFSIGLIDCYCLSPINLQEFYKLIKNKKHLITLEEHTLNGGLGSIVAELLADTQLSIPLKRIGLTSQFRFEVGEREWMRQLDHLDRPNIIKTITSCIKNQKEESYDNIANSSI